MNLFEAFQIINAIAKDNGINRPFLVGGAVRQLLQGNTEFNDFDIATGHDDINALAKLTAEHFGVRIKTLQSGGKQMILDQVKIDFSSNFRYPNIDRLLKEREIHASEINKEIYSRDFTINAIMLSLDFKNLYDPTGGINDLANNVLRCPLDCDVSFAAKPTRILRAIKFHCTKDLAIPDEMFASILQHKDLLQGVDRHYAGSMLNECVRAKPEILHLLIDSGLMAHLPLTKYVIEILVHSKQIIRVL